MYAEILSSLTDDYKAPIIRILRFLVYGSDNSESKLLSLEEAQDIVAVRLDKDPAFHPSYRPANLDGILEACPLLIVTQSSGGRSLLQLVHTSVRDYLLARGKAEARKTDTQQGAFIYLVEDFLNTTKSVLLENGYHSQQINETLGRMVDRRQRQDEAARSNLSKAGYSPSQIERIMSSMSKAPRTSVKTMVLDAQHAGIEPGVIGSIVATTSMTVELTADPSTTSFVEEISLLDIVSVSLGYLLSIKGDIAAESSDLDEPATVLQAYPFAAPAAIQWSYGMQRLDIHDETILHQAIELLTDVRYYKLVLLFDRGIASIHTQAMLSSALIPICYAASKGLHRVVDKLATLSPDIDLVGKGTRDPLRAALEANSMHTVRTLLRRGAKIFSDEDYYSSALSRQSFGDMADMVQVLISNGASVEALGHHAHSALIEGVKVGDESLVNRLLDAGVNVHEDESRDFTLPVATARGYMRVIRALVKSGADVDAFHVTFGTALMEAARVGQPDVMLFLLEHGAAPDLSEPDHESALVAAVGAGHIDCVHMLLRYGADVNLLTYGHRSALQISASQGNTECLEICLKQGADPDLSNGKHACAISMAAAGGKTECIEMLCGYGANPDLVTYEHRAPLQIAALTRHVESVELLALLGAQIDLSTSEYPPALTCATWKGELACVRALIHWKANVNFCHKIVGTALLAACTHSQLTIARYLLSNGADPNLARGDGTTPLSAALSKDNIDMVKLLLERGANPTYQDRDIDSPIAAAARKGHTEILRPMLETKTEFVTISNYRSLLEDALMAARSENNEDVAQFIRDRLIEDEQNTSAGTLNESMSSDHQGAETTIVHDGSNDTTSRQLDCDTILSSLPDDTVTGVTRILQFMLHARIVDPDVVNLNVEAALDAVATNLDTNPAFRSSYRLLSEQRILETCPLLKIESTDIGRRFNWLEDRIPDHLLRNAEKKGLFPEQDSLRMITHILVKYLLSIETGLEREVLLLKYPLAPFAARNWAKNLRAIDKPSEVIRQDAMELLTNIERYALMRSLYDPDTSYATPGRLYTTAFSEPLYFAAIEGLEELVRMLLSMGIHLNSQYGTYGTVLHAAALSGNEVAIQALIDAGADVHAEKGSYGFACIAAAASGSVAAVKCLLAAGAEIDAVSEKSKPAIVVAAEKGQLDVITFLIDVGAEIDLRLEDRETALIAACANGTPDIVERLLDAGANPHIQDDYFGGTLQAAAFSGNTVALELLLKAGTDVNADGGQWDSALIVASQKGEVEAMKILLRAGADVNAIHPLYGTALAVAAYAGNIEGVSLLLEADADVDVVGGNYGTAVAAAAYGGGIECLRSLLEAGAHINAPAGSYGTVLQASCAGFGDVKVVSHLIEHGANVNALGGGYGSPLLAAVNQGRLDVMKVLIDAGAKPVDLNEHRSILDSAVDGFWIDEEKCLAALKLLIDHGAQVNQRSGSSALAAAKRRNLSRIVDFLQAQGFSDE